MPDIGMTFATALRAMLRQAPNIVMVGEIRDRETADIAINASLTGHLVFSTLHTNDAPGAITRLIGYRRETLSCGRGIAGQSRPAPGPADLSALQARLSARRRTNCRRWAWTDAQISGAQFAHGAGCAACHGTGYRGRLGIFEIFLVNDEFAQLIYENASAARLRQQGQGGWHAHLAGGWDSQSPCRPHHNRRSCIRDRRRYRLITDHPYRHELRNERSSRAGRRPETLRSPPAGRHAADAPPARQHDADRRPGAHARTTRRS